MPIQLNPLNQIEGLPNSRFNSAGDLVRLTGALDPTGQAGKVIGIGPGDVATLISIATIELPFSYGDASPALIFTAPANKIIYNVRLVINIAFDGTGASLTVGDIGTPDLFMSSTQNDPTQVGNYSSSPSYVYGIPTQVNLSITPGSGATQGSGLVVISIQS